MVTDADSNETRNEIRFSKVWKFLWQKWMDRKISGGPGESEALLWGWDSGIVFCVKFLEIPETSFMHLNEVDPIAHSWKIMVKNV